MELVNGAEESDFQEDELVAIVLGVAILLSPARSMLTVIRSKRQSRKKQKSSERTLLDFVILLTQIRRMPSAPPTSSHTPLALCTSSLPAIRRLPSAPPTSSHTPHALCTSNLRPYATCPLHLQPSVDGTYAAPVLKHSVALVVHWRDDLWMAPLEIRFADTSGGHVRRLVVELPPHVESKHHHEDSVEGGEHFVYTMEDPSVINGWVVYKGAISGGRSQATSSQNHAREKRGKQR